MFWFYRLTDIILTIVAVFCALILLGLLTRWIRIFVVDSKSGGRIVSEYVIAVGSPERLITIKAGCWIEEASKRG